MEGYKGYKKTNLKTYIHGKYRRVYEKNGKLYFRADNRWGETYRNYCEEEIEDEKTTCTKKIPCSSCANYETCWWTKK